MAVKPNLLDYQQGRVLMRRHQQKRRNRHKGFSLIELATVVTLLAVMLSIALPAVTDWIATQRVRAAAEGMVNGLQLARAEAIRSNTLINLEIGAGGISWEIYVTPPPNTARDVGLQPTVQRRGAESSSNITITAYTDTATPIGLPAIVTFNGLGRMTAPDKGAFSINYASSVSGVRAMCATVMSNTPKLCDPQLTDVNDPRSCFVRDSAGNRVKVNGC